MILKDIAYYVDESIISDDIEKFQYVTTDSLLQNKEGRTIATNMPPQSCSLTHFMPGDVLIANIRPYLKKIWKADIEGGCSKDVLVIRAKEGHFTEFVYALAMQDSFFENAMLGIKGTQMPRGDKNKIMEFPVYIHSGKEEQKLGELIDKIQKKIALNTRMNAELEAMAKQLYDYWFVQFDFPDENGNPYKSSGGKMVYNPTLKREIPAGWEVSSLSSVIGKDKSGDWGQDIEKGCYKIKVNCIRGADLKDSLNAPIRFINEKNVNRLLSEDDIIVEISGGSPVQATGRTLYVSKGLLDWYNKRLTCSNFCRPLVLSDNKDAPYFYYTWNLFYDNGIMFNFEGKTSGIKNLLLDMILGTYWYFPPSNINNRFCDIIKKNLKLIDSNKTEIENLKSLRDSLLPMLMNGQVTVE
jgi:type I restriction enzyme S subunit